MSDLKMGPVETRFAEIIWEKEPVGSMELVKLRRTLLGLSQEKLGESIGLTFQQVQKYERGLNQ